MTFYVRPSLKTAVERSSLEELLKIFKHKNFATQLSTGEKLLIKEKICEHCRYYSFAFKKCDAPLAIWKEKCFLREHDWV